MNIRHPNIILVVLTLASMLSHVDRNILNLLVDPIRHSLQISDFQFSLIQGAAFAVFYATLGLPIGILADRRSRKTIIGCGIIVWSLMTAVCGLSTTFAVLFLARVGVAAGEATLSPAGFSLLSDSFSRERLARAVGLFTIGSPLGGGLAYFLGGPLIHKLSEHGPFAFPIVGTMQPWQLTFVLAGLPGVLLGVIALKIQEPIRTGVLSDQGGKQLKVPLTRLFTYLRPQRQAYLCIFAAVTLLAIPSYSIVNWYPAFLMRTYSLPVNVVGFWFGLVYLVFGIAGAIVGPLTATWLERRGYKDSQVRTIFLLALGALPCGVIAPFMPTAPLALAVGAPMIFVAHAYYGVAIAGLALITPNQVRAFTTALFILVILLVSLGAGSSAVPLVSDLAGGDLRLGLLVSAAVGCPLAALFAWLGLRPFARSLDAAGILAGARDLSEARTS